MHTMHAGLDGPRAHIEAIERYRREVSWNAAKAGRAMVG